MGVWFICSFSEMNLQLPFVMGLLLSFIKTCFMPYYVLVETKGLISVMILMTSEKPHLNQTEFSQRMFFFCKNLKNKKNLFSLIFRWWCHSYSFIQSSDTRYLNSDSNSDSLYFFTWMQQYLTEKKVGFIWGSVTDLIKTCSRVSISQLENTLVEESL